jgi:subtilase family serine protease
VSALSLPDLTVFSPQTYVMNMNGTKLAIISFKVKNIGSATAPSSFASISGIYNSILSVKSLPIGGTYLITKAYPCSYSHNVTITVDSTKIVNEASENNNKYTTFVNC